MKVLCVKDTILSIKGIITIHEWFLTIGTWYEVQDDDINSYYIIVNDRGVRCQYFKEFFKTLGEIRKEKLEKIKQL